VKILATGDHHFDERSRFAECQRVHDFMVDVARRESVDVFLSGGDLFERNSAIAEREAVSEWLTKLAEVCPAVIAKGNHEKELELAILARLRTKHPVIVEERAAVHRIAGASIAAVAWPNRAAVMAMLGRPVPAEGLDRAALEALRDVLRSLGDEMAQHDGPRILLGHFMCEGSIASTGQPLLGLPLTVTLSDLALARASVGFLSHIHKRQAFEHLGVQYLYTGSSFRTDTGQLEEKSITLATFEGSRLVALEHIPTPCADLVHLEATWKEGRFEYAPGDYDRAVRAGCEVRFSYRVNPDERDAAKRAAETFARELRGFGATVGRPEEDVQARARARVPELAGASSLAEKLPMVWASKGDVIAPERAARLLRMLAEVEQERHGSEGSSGDIYAAAAMGHGAPHELVRFEAHNMHPFEDFTIDLSSLGSDQLLVAITGENGAGKSTALELAFHGAMYRKTPTHGKLLEIATARDSWIRSVFSNGRDTIEVRHELDMNGEQRAFVAENGSRVLEDEKVSTFDAWADRRFVPVEMLNASIFAVQGATGFLGEKEGGRKAIVLRALGLEFLEDLAKRASVHARRNSDELVTLEARIADEKARGGDLDALETALDEARAAETSAEAALVVAGQPSNRLVQRSARQSRPIRRRKSSGSAGESLRSCSPRSGKRSGTSARGSRITAWCSRTPRRSVEHRRASRR
jgi:DNA repair exonuclease SbcCD nuclease subunit